jgi:cysteine-rich repeat protein
MVEGIGSDPASACQEVITYCGDGIVNHGEACDDGNNIDDDECSNTCVERLDPIEVCSGDVVFVLDDSASMDPSRL